MLDKTKEHIQNMAVSIWEKNNKIGTIEAVTGIGKTFIFLKSLHTCPKGIRVLFLAEQIDRKYDLLKDIKKFDSIYNTKTLFEYNIEFMTYQSAYKLRGQYFDFVCADEIHDSLTPKYVLFYLNNKYKYIIGLSATINNVTYELDNGYIVTKLDWLNSICPIIFKYSIKQGQIDKTIRPLNIIVVECALDKNKNIVKRDKNNNIFYVSEYDLYNYWDKSVNKYIIDRNEFMIKKAASMRAHILYSMKSKIIIVKEILKQLKGKTLLFGNDLSSLKEITSNVICSHNNENVNNSIRNDFESGKIEIIASFKKLKQGANLSNLDNIIIMSYYSTTKDLVQRIGRLRKSGEKIGNVIILMTKNTQEEKWFNKMFKGVDLTLNLIKSDEINKINSYLKY